MGSADWSTGDHVVTLSHAPLGRDVRWQERNCLIKVDYLPLLIYGPVSHSVCIITGLVLLASFLSGSYLVLTPINSSESPVTQILGLLRHWGMYIYPTCLKWQVLSLSSNFMSYNSMSSFFLEYTCIYFSPMKDMISRGQNKLNYKVN